MESRKAAALRHPEHIHPALWRGSQLARAGLRTVSTGHRMLDPALPGKGWPLGALVEFALDRPGAGEISLLRPALSALDGQRSIVLLQPPCQPHFHCWANWGLAGRRLLKVDADSPADTLWACEKILKYNACAALICWLPAARPQSLRRLHLAAAQSDILFIAMRPAAALGQPSAAPLRLSLRPCEHGLDITIVKRQGPACGQPIRIPLYPARTPSLPFATPHAPLDMPSLAHAQPGRALSALVH